MTSTDVLPRPNAPPRAHRKAATTDREAAEFIASCFSCLEQIEQLTGRKTQHIAEIMADALGVLPPPPPRGLDRQFAISAGILALGLVIGAAISAAPLFRSTALQLRAANVR
ncbi:MAG TPA: hypothetical protein VGN21_18655 [Stellaceae bacterium]